MENLKKFFSNFQTITLPEHTVINLGQLDGSVYFLKQGYIKRIILNDNGLEFILSLKHTNSIFPLTDVSEGFLAENTYKTMTEVEFVKASEKEFHEFLFKNLPALREYNQILIKELTTYQKRLFNLATADISKKILYVLIFYADLLGQTKEKKVEIQFPLTHDEIASWIGVSRETVSICLKKLQDEELIDYNRKIFVLKNYAKIKELIAISLKDF